MSIIIVALLATFTLRDSDPGIFSQQDYLSKLDSFHLQIGGLNESELANLRFLAEPLETSVVQKFGAWSGNWVVEVAQEGHDSERMRLLATPPLKHAAPFLACIKTWGYQITFYQSYQEKQEFLQQGCISTEMTPSIVHSWILEKK